MQSLFAIPFLTERPKLTCPQFKCIYICSSICGNFSRITDMLGAICKNDVFWHPIVTIRCFGWNVFWRTLVANREMTFLDVVMENRRQSPEERVHVLVSRCKNLELLAERLYLTFAERFAASPQAEDFFRTISTQEHKHAELLEICQAAMEKGQWDEDLLQMLQDGLPAVEQKIRALGEEAMKATMLDEALRYVIQIESAEINKIFNSIIDSCDSAFLRGIKTFRKAGRVHIDYICCVIPQIDASLKRACDALAERYKMNSAVLE